MPNFININGSKTITQEYCKEVVLFGFQHGFSYVIKTSCPMNVALSSMGIVNAMLKDDKHLVIGTINQCAKAEQLLIKFAEYHEAGVQIRIEPIQHFVVL